MVPASGFLYAFFFPVSGRNHSAGVGVPTVHRLRPGTAKTLCGQIEAHHPQIRIEVSAGPTRRGDVVCEVCRKIAETPDDPA